MLYFQVVIERVYKRVYKKVYEKIFPKEKVFSLAVFLCQISGNFNEISSCCILPFIVRGNFFRKPKGLQEGLHHKCSKINRIK